MFIIGHGIDILDLSEIQCIVNNSEMEKHFLERTFTSRELADCGNAANRVEKLSARMAAKEAVMKTLGEGFGNGVSFHDVEIWKCAKGTPQVILHRKLKELADQMGIAKWYLSLSHSKTAVVASAIAVQEKV